MCSICSMVGSTHSTVCPLHLVPITAKYDATTGTIKTPRSHGLLGWPGASPEKGPSVCPNAEHFEAVPCTPCQAHWKSVFTVDALTWLPADGEPQDSRDPVSVTGQRLHLACLLFASALIFKSKQTSKIREWNQKNKNAKSLLILFGYLQLSLGLVKLRSSCCDKSFPHRNKTLKKI